MNRFDIGIAWEWEYDRDFVYLLNDTALKWCLKPYMISHYNLPETLEKIEREEISFLHIIDRASDADPTFTPLVESLMKGRTKFLNFPSLMDDADNKAKMHLEFMANGIDVPYTIILSPTDSFDDRHPHLKAVGIPFVVKPASGGGGVGVTLDAKIPYTVIEARLRNGGGPHLIQENIVPKNIRSRRAWSRVFYVCGKVIPCWWDDRTHTYTTLTDREEKEFSKLKEIAMIAHKISGLNFFSTEVAITEEGKFIAVDYINNVCDMRLQSKAHDGVPDTIVAEIVNTIIDWSRTAGDNKAI
jgi:glutathione synthase/RimK-type ligase-like ATP-grasp enzyme